jgi:hypothetical protein
MFYVLFVLSSVFPIPCTCIFVYENTAHRLLSIGSSGKFYILWYYTKNKFCKELTSKLTFDFRPRSMDF